MLNAIILAGAQPVKNRDLSGNKALLQINGKIMVEYVIDAVKNADDIGKVIVVGSKSELEEHLAGKVDAIIDSSGAIMENIMKGIEYLGFNEYILVCSSDIPLVTTEAINDFVARSKSTGADFCYPIIEKKVNEREYPGIERTYVTLKEGTFTGGNVFYLNPEAVEKGFVLADKLLKVRKNPFKMAGMLSFGFILQLSAGTLTITRVEKKFSGILNIKARAVISEYPEIGNDVDKPSDVAIITAHLK